MRREGKREKERENEKSEKRRRENEKNEEIKKKGDKRERNFCSRKSGNAWHRIFKEAKLIFIFLLSLCFMAHDVHFLCHACSLSAFLSSTCMFP